jgi:hypothetical protein
LRKLTVRQVPSHQVQTEHPDPQRLMLSGKDGVGSVTQVSPTLLTLVALAVWLGLVLATLHDLSTATLRAAYPSFPPQLAHRFVALGIVNQTSEIEVEHDNSELLVRWQPTKRLCSTPPPWITD